MVFKSCSIRIDLNYRQVSTLPSSKLTDLRGRFGKAAKPGSFQDRTLSELPAIERVREVLGCHWDIAPEAVSLWPKSARMFRVEGYGFARVGFPRGGLTAAQLVEFVDRLSQIKTQQLP